APPRRPRLGGASSTCLRAALLVFGLLTATASCVGTSSAGSASDPRSRGLVAHLAGRLDEATAAYFEALQQDPRNKYAFFDLDQIAQAIRLDKTLAPPASAPNLNPGGTP